MKIGSSEVEDGGEGLKARVDIPNGTLVSYYHGVRMKPEDENIFGKATGYAIYVEWETEAKKNSDILDIPPQVSCFNLIQPVTNQFCSTNLRRTIHQHWHIR